MANFSLKAVTGCHGQLACPCENPRYRFATSHGQTSCPWHPALCKRHGMTIIEVTVALAILGILTVIVAQCIVWSLHERTRLAAHQAALELAANTLETARAQAWPDLNQKWADALIVPVYMADLLPEGKLACTVQPEQPSPHCRRIIVEVSWNFTSNLPAESVILTTILSERTAKTGGQP